MATAIIQPIAPPGRESGSTRILVQEDFERAMEISMPLQQPASALEARERCTLTKLDGSRVFINPQIGIGSIEENAEEDV